MKTIQDRIDDQKPKDVPMSGGQKVTALILILGVIAFLYFLVVVMGDQHVDEHSQYYITVNIT